MYYILSFAAAAWRAVAEENKTKNHMFLAKVPLVVVVVVVVVGTAPQWVCPKPGAKFCVK
jgi:hypothetical protein